MSAMAIFRQLLAASVDLQVVVKSLSLTLPIHKKLALASPAAHNCSDMDRSLGEFVATMIGGMVTIFTVAVALLRRLRKRQLRRVNQQLDEILADSTVLKDGSFTKSL